MREISFGPRARYAVAKVPQITILFWIAKVITTALGESTSDFLVTHMNPYMAVLGGLVAFLLAMKLQFTVKKYIPWVYWLAALMVAVFGTMAADSVHVALGVPYQLSTLGFAIALAVIFALWYASEKTLSIHSIDTPRRELFYWSTVFATFTLGTAAGDLTATAFGWGFLSSGIIFTGIIGAIALSFFILKAILGPRHRYLLGSSILAFWLAYIDTRPLGASFADWMDKPHFMSGLAWGDGRVSVMLLIPLVVVVAYLQITHRDVAAEARDAVTTPSAIESPLIQEKLEGSE